MVLLIRVVLIQTSCHLVEYLHVALVSGLDYCVLDEVWVFDLVHRLLAIEHVVQCRIRHLLHSVGISLLV